MGIDPEKKYYKISFFKSLIFSIAKIDQNQTTKLFWFIFLKYMRLVIIFIKNLLVVIIDLLFNICLEFFSLKSL